MGACVLALNEGVGFTIRGILYVRHLCGGEFIHIFERWMGEEEEASC